MALSAPFAVFGPGSIYVTRNDVSTTQTPFNIGFGQEFTIERSADSKELFGQYSDALEVATGTIKTTGKIKAAKINGAALAAVLGASASSGSVRLAPDEAHIIPSAAAYTVVVTNAAKFDVDLGVTAADTGAPFQRVTAGPTTGQYSVDPATGTYTFAAADADKAVLINYAYTSTDGSTFTVGAQLIGAAPTFQIDYATTYNGHSFFIRVFKARCPKLTLASKLTDFMMPEFDFTAQMNAARNVLMMSDGTVS